MAKRTKGILAALVVVAGTAVWLAAGATATPRAQGPIKIGISLSLSGDFSDPGKAVKRGYDLWAAYVNAHGGILGRQVQLKIVDDASSPNQVVTNYQTLITRDHVDLVFGPFSSLLTGPAATVANRYHYAFLEPAGGGPAVFALKLHNLFFVQPAPGRQMRRQLRRVPEDPARRRSGRRRRRTPSLDDPFSSPIADAMRAQLQASGVKTLYHTIYPAETTDLTPIIAKAIAPKPDMIIGGTQSDDAYAQVKALIQAEVQPEVPVLRQRRQLADRVPEQGRREERQRDLQLQRLDADRAVERQRALRRPVPEALRRQQVPDRQQLRPRPGRSGSCCSWP